MIEIEARKEAASRTARLDAVFAALADPTRRAIIERLSRSEARVTEVAEPFHMSLNAVSKHIRVLEASGVIERRRKGRDHILSIVSMCELDAIRPRADVRVELLGS
jgi:DNA-binding transcriptional ArsR family regulator